MFRQLSADLFHRLVQVDLNGFAFFHISEFFWNQFSRFVVEFFDPQTFAVDLALNVSVCRAADADTDRAAGAVTRQTNHANVVSKILAAELCAQADVVGQFKKFVFEFYIAESASGFITGCR